MGTRRSGIPIAGQSQRAVKLGAVAFNIGKIPGMELVEPGYPSKGFSLRVATSGNRMSMTLVKPIPPELQIFTYTGGDAALVIHGVRAASHDDAARVLADLALPIFVDLSISFDIACGLTRHRIPGHDDHDDQPGISGRPRFPMTQYNRDAASLYLHARSLTHLGPVMFRYLAFFQVIEFFAPVHARGELGRVSKGV